MPGSISEAAPLRGTGANASAGPAANGRRTWRTPLIVGSAAALAVVGLRYAGVASGPTAIVIAVLCFVFAPGPSKMSERCIAFFALGLGWLPLVGWIPALGTAVDVPGIVLAVGVGVTCVHQMRLRAPRPRIATFPTPLEAVGLAIGPVVALWWALPLLHLRVSGRLQYLFTGFDNNTHFAMFRSDIQLGSFIAVRRNLPHGALRVGWDYPQGLHQAWAQLVRLWTTHPPTSTSWLLNAYAAMLVLTTAGIIALGCMAITRLGRNDPLAALPAMAVVVTVFGFGRFELFNGFPNFDVAIGAAAVAVTLLLRPTLSPRGNFFTIAGLGLVVAYNWYPFLILVVPAVVVAAIRLREAASERTRGITTTAVVATAVAYLLPALLFLHRGVGTLASTYGTFVPPWALLVLCVVGLGAVVAYRQVTRPNLLTNLALVAPAALGGGAVVLLALYDIASTGNVTYYGEKIAAGVFAACLIVLAAVLASHVAVHGASRRLSRLVVTGLTVLATAAALQIDGYVGPSPHALQASDVASGIAAHDVLTAQPPVSPPALQLLLAARAAQRQEATHPPGAEGQWWYVDPAPIYFGATLYSLYGLWFSDLRGDPTAEEYNTIGFKLAAKLDSVPSLVDEATVVVKHFGPPRASLHIFVPQDLRDQIIRLDPVWGRPGLLITLPRTP
jgi:hypothetical protein